MLEGLAVILVRPRYPENVGAAARACLNMGCPKLRLVSPEEPDLARALPMATSHARHILEQAEVFPDLGAALADLDAAFGATARLGGWRQAVSAPRTLAADVAARLSRGQRLGLVFGSEDRGLENAETMLLDGLCSIPTAVEGASLNLAQAVMVLLHECFQARRAARGPGDAPAPRRASVGMQEREALVQAMRQALLAIDFLKDQNTDYFLLPARRALSRLAPSRAEYDMLMGVCRQILWACGKK